jgi:hypothetical protein
MSGIRAEQVEAMGGCAPCQPAAPPNLARPPQPARPPGPPVIVASRDKPSWVAIELVDEAGKPVPGEPFRVTLPDGSPIEGLLDKRGTVRIEGIDPGTCKVTFPERDAKGWRPGGAG